MIPTYLRIDITADCFVPPWVRRVWSVYVVNRDERTYCCELTPSYALHWIETYPEVNATGRADDGSPIPVPAPWEQETLTNELNVPEDIRYQHKIGRGKRGPRCDSIADAIEWYCGNPRW